MPCTGCVGALVHRACDNKGKPGKQAGEMSARESSGPLRDTAMTLGVDGRPVAVEPGSFKPVKGVSMGSAGGNQQASDHEPSGSPLAGSSGAGRGPLASSGGASPCREVISVSRELRGVEVASPVTPIKGSSDKGLSDLCENGIGFAKSVIPRRGPNCVSDEFSIQVGGIRLTFKISRGTAELRQK